MNSYNSSCKYYNSRKINKCINGRIEYLVEIINSYNSSCKYYDSRKINKCINDKVEHLVEIEPWNYKIMRQKVTIYSYTGKNCRISKKLESPTGPSQRVDTIYIQFNSKIRLEDFSMGLLNQNLSKYAGTVFKNFK